MAKGTPSHGRKNSTVGTTHCRRCGRRSYHKRKKKCSSCGYGLSKTVRKYAWQVK